jgi:hypothetical protein
MWKRLWEGWKRLAHRIGNFQARVLLTLLYAILVFPFGVVVRLLADPLRIKHRPEAWLAHPESPATLEWSRRQ